MANPPFNLDITDPADNAVVSQFPANERVLRDNVNSYLNTEHDISTGYHKFQVLTPTQISALSTPPTGMTVWDNQQVCMKINVGTPGAPSWQRLGVPAGTIIDCYGAVPTGYLEADGSTFSSATYPDLYAYLGNSTTLPDLRGRITAGNDSATGRLNASGQFTNAGLGTVGGEAAHTLTTNELAVHSHPSTLSDAGHFHTTTVDETSGGSFQLEHRLPSGGNTTYGSEGYDSDTKTSNITLTNANAGGGAAHNNVQPTVIVRKCIKT